MNTQKHFAVSNDLSLNLSTVAVKMILYCRAEAIAISLEAIPSSLFQLPIHCALRHLCGGNATPAGKSDINHTKSQLHAHCFNPLREAI